MKLEAKHVDELKEFFGVVFRRDVVVELHDHPDGDDVKCGNLVIVEFGISLHATLEGFVVSTLTPYGKPPHEDVDIHEEVTHATWAAALFDVGKRLVEQLFAEVVDRKSDAAFAEDLKQEQALALNWKDVT